MILKEISMGNNSDCRKERIWVYLIAPATVCLLTLFTYFIKGIYPFGIKTVDYHDMGQEVVAFFYHAYDYLHGNKAPYYDWYTGLGMNMSNGVGGASNYSLFDILLLFVKREKILECMSIFLCIRMMCMSMSFGYALRKISPCTEMTVKYILCVIYGMCGYVMMNYTLLVWLDVAVLFPIIVASLKDLIVKGKNIIYIVTLSLTLATSYYLSFMILVYLFVSVGLYFAIQKIYFKNNNMCNVIKFGFSTLLSVGLSAIVLVPQLIQTTSSSRFSNNSDLMTIMSTYRSTDGSRWWSILGMTLPVALIIVGIIRNTRKKEKKYIGKYIFILGLIAFTVSELLFENVNLIMHFGSYVHYPIRNGFIISFTILMAAALIWGDEEHKGITDEGYTDKSPDGIKKNIVITRMITYVIVCAAIIIAVCTVIYYGQTEYIEIGGVIRITKIIGIVYFVVSTVALLTIHQSKLKIVLPVIVVCELIIYSYIFIGPISFITHYAEEPEQESDYVRVSNELKDKLSISDSYIDRIKNPDETLNANYGFILGRPSLANGTHLVTKDAQNGAVTIGYSIQFTRLLDSGGTAFTDAMLHVTDTLTDIEQDSSLYESTGSANATVDHETGEERLFTLYKNKYTLPFGMVVRNEADIEAIAAVQDIISFHNITYRALLNVNDTSVEGDLAELVCGVTEGDNTAHIEGNKLLYYWGACADSEYMNTTLYVNGKTVPVPTIKDNDNICYPSHFNNGTLFLGSFSDCDVTVHVVKNHDVDAPDYLEGLFTVDLDKLAVVCDAQNKANGTGEVRQGKTSLGMDINAQDGNWLLVPIAYDEGIHIYNNGSECNTVNVQGLFTAVGLEPGQNHVELRYVPKGMVLGIVISSVSAIFFALYIVLSLYLKRKSNSGIATLCEKLCTFDNTVMNVYIGVWFLVVTAIFIIPSVWSLLHYWGS